MGIEIIFYPTVAMMLLAAGVVVFARQPVTSVLALVFTFVSAAILWMLLCAEFLSLVLILVYVGAVMTLFLFVVMMMDVRTQPHQEGWVKYWPISFIVVSLILAVLIYTFGPRAEVLFRALSEPEFSAQYSNVRALGEVLYTEHLWSFEVAALILLVGIVAAIVLAYGGPRQRRTQSIESQVQTQKSDRLKIISMPPEERL